ncbi:hypothetical protein IV203_029699 [Nitzschia inconspicua]|uniref:Transmembrane protein n=1 Tax=Nitzschia inconspicua TaxID=303405 RepID=A0A9K3LSA9_9STRA|nr:hypothetical protein IV203_029699 [Nitzschia inconspicua]
MDRCDRRCGYLLQISNLFLMCGGILLSVLASENCEFLRFESVSNNTSLGPPFDNSVSKGWVGIFRFQVDAESGCTLYDGIFTKAPIGTLVASQVCAIVAPFLSFSAVMVSVSDVLCCRFYGNFILMAILLLTAAAFQGGTFVIFAQPSLCNDSAVHCGGGTAAYFSAAAAASFFLACILLCCSPRPEPCQKRKDTFREDDNLMTESPIFIQPELSVNHSSTSGTPSAEVNQGGEEDND